MQVYISSDATLDIFANNECFAKKSLFQWSITNTFPTFVNVIVMNFWINLEKDEKDPICTQYSKQESF